MSIESYTLYYIYIRSLPFIAGKAYSLIFADDTALVSEDAGNMQLALDSLERYCEHCCQHQKDKANETNEVIIAYKGEKIKEVILYKYLGFVIANSSFLEGVEELALSARKAVNT